MLKITAISHLYTVFAQHCLLASCQSMLHLYSCTSFMAKLEGKYSLESTDPRESEIRAHLRP